MQWSLAVAMVTAAACSNTELALASNHTMHQEHSLTPDCIRTPPDVSYCFALTEVKGQSVRIKYMKCSS